MIISKSGESPEIRVLLPLIKNFGNTLIAMTGNDQSLLTRQADIFLNTTVSEEHAQTTSHNQQHHCSVGDG
jgi:arabinose-5-phosphate isomerase